MAFVRSGVHAVHNRLFPLNKLVLRQQRSIFTTVPRHASVVPRFHYHSPYPIHSHFRLGFRFVFDKFSFHNPLRSSSTMPPVDAQFDIDKVITENKVVIFSKTTCPFCSRVKQLFQELNIQPLIYELDNLSNGLQIHEVVKQKVGRTSVPQVFIRGQHIGGCDDTLAKHESGGLANLLKDHEYQYDVIVVGGGSGGLSASKEAARYGKKVAVLDYVKPSPPGTTWGLGGTCVNVGCIPKKLMHTASIYGQVLRDAYSYGWQTKDGQEFSKETTSHNWERMKDEIQNYIKSINFNYRVELRSKQVEYLNSYGTFIDPHTIRAVDKKGNEKILTSENFIIATGERPRYPSDCSGALEYGITSDDVFSLSYNPGKTLVVGASYVALECAGFLRGIGNDVTVMVRSILLRGFDQEIAEKIGKYMADEEGVKFIRPCVPTKIEQIEAGQPGRLRVTGRMQDGTEMVDEFNTVLFAIGRDPCTGNIGLENTGVTVLKNGKIPADEGEKTNVDNIYAIGDILQGKPELTPVAIQAGKLLARRLYGGVNALTDYINVPTTVFTPIEYGSCGYSEENAIATFGEENIEVYILNFIPLEWQPAHRPENNDNSSYAKLITLKNENDRIIGLHYLGPNAGEVTQFAGIALKLKATKYDLNSLIGIHPTCAEVFTTLRVTKRSGESAAATGC